MALLRQGAGHQFHQMDRHHGHMAAAEDGDPALAAVLEQGQFLSQGVDPVEGRKI